MTGASSRRMDRPLIPARAADVLIWIMVACMGLLSAQTTLDLVKLLDKPAVISPPPAVPGSVKPDLAASLERLERETGVRSAVTDRGVTFTLTETILFASGKADISEPGRAVLDGIAPILRSGGGRIRIEGHTDDMPIRRSPYGSNVALSMARAMNVAAYFVETDGLEADRIAATGHGDQKPLFPNDTQAHRAANRRVEILLETGDDDSS